MPRSAEKIEKELRSESFDKLIFGEISEDQFWASLKNEYKWEAQIDDLKKAVRETMVPVHGTMDVVQQLSDKKVRLALLSGHAKEWALYLQEKYKFHHYFDKIVYSYMTGYGKKNIEFYKDMLQLLDVPPGECLFIDDDHEHLEIAGKLGIKGVLFEDADQLKAKLSSIL